MLGLQAKRPGPGESGQDHLGSTKMIRRSDEAGMGSDEVGVG